MSDDRGLRQVRNASRLLLIYGMIVAAGAFFVALGQLPSPWTGIDNRLGLVLLAATAGTYVMTSRMLLRRAPFILPLAVMLFVLAVISSLLGVLVGGAGLFFLLQADSRAWIRNAAVPLEFTDGEEE